MPNTADKDPGVSGVSKDEEECEKYTFPGQPYNQSGVKSKTFIEKH